MVVHETEHWLQMIKKDQTLCVIFIVGDSREDVLDRRKPLNPEQGWAVVTDTGAFREASLAVRSRVLPAISEDDINAHPGELWERVFSRAPIFSWSDLVFGSIASSITGSGASIFSKIIGLAGSASVSQVVVSLRPKKAAICPAEISAISSCLLECMRSKRPTLSFFPVLALRS